MFLASLHDIDRHITQWITQTGLPIEELLRLLLAAIVGGMVGMEREVRGRQAGFRTNLLVCVGSALVMIVSNALAGEKWTPQGFQISVDPGRIANGVMMGVGFIGAGTILKQRGTVRGLTTATALWCVAAIGLAAGFGLYLLCIVSGVLVVGALWVLDYLEAFLPHVRYRNVTVRMPWKPDCIGQLVEYFKSHGLEVVDVTFQRTADLNCVDVSLHVAFVTQEQFYKLEHQLEDGTGYQLLAVNHDP